MNSSKLLLSFLILFSISAFSQTSTNTKKKKPQKTTTYYYKNSNGIGEIGRIKPKSTLVLGSKIKLKEIDSVGIKTIGTQAAIIIVKEVINHIGTVVYKPEKFAKENSAEQKFISLKTTIDFKKLDNEKLYYFNHSEKPDSNKIVIDSMNQTFEFSIHNNPDNDQFKILKFDGYLYKYTGVKLKKKHHKVNVLLDFKVNYFDEDGFLQSIDLKTIELKKITPGGAKAKFTPTKNDIYRFISTKYQIASIQLTVNEVNAKKKTWDKWLKLYNDNKDKIKDAIVDQIEGDDEEE
ncbi:hypothetical protein BTO06_06390 [Tenacibaculum sp. SZ-18]|uniref:hypothetical protein n=1 Tax=Tenacibaculum sp. SZ-18 TaxID=754423 RepID=UPI000C2D52D6|nr:hypothetical protein [Tenacibaculum sp. SZ-18]AUC14793.1 hypothetical protein BTO06_06390 [Tenacibaculum sp. SZ-18]